MSGRNRSFTGVEAIRVLQRRGFIPLRRNRGDHIILTRGRNRISIPDQSSTLGRALHHRINKLLRGVRA